MTLITGTVRPYTKSYVGQAAQSGTSAPTQDAVFENTIGTDESPITYARVSVGQYTITGTFPFGRTVCPPFPSQSVGAMIPLFLNTPGDTFYNIVVQNENVLAITFYNSAGDFIEWSDAGAEILIQIIVYPAP